MEQEQQNRLALFRKISGALLSITTPSLIFVAIIILVCLCILILKPLGSTSLLDVSHLLTSASKVDSDSLRNFFIDHRLDFMSKVILSSMVAAIGGLCLKALFHFSQLLECFYDGEIFTRRALTQARLAYRFNIYGNLALILSYLGLLCFSLSASAQDVAPRISFFIFDIGLSTAISIGFYSLILWALEMGTDLTEDAALTI